MQSASNNYSVVQNLKIITFQVFQSFIQWPEDFGSFEQWPKTQQDVNKIKDF